MTEKGFGSGKRQKHEYPGKLIVLEGTDGVQKMSKSYGNYIGLKEDAKDMFGKCMRITDAQILRYFELTTTLTGAEIDAIEAAHLKEGGNPKDAKLKLAHRIVSQYHGAEAGDKALSDWNNVHSEGQVPDDMPLHTVSEAQAIFRVLVESKLVATTSEAKRLCGESGVKLDGETIKDQNFQVVLGKGEEKVLQVGRRKFARLVNK